MSLTDKTLFVIIIATLAITATNAAQSKEDILDEAEATVKELAKASKLPKE